MTHYLKAILLFHLSYHNYANRRCFRQLYIFISNAISNKYLCTLIIIDLIFNYLDTDCAKSQPIGGVVRNFRLEDSTSSPIGWSSGPRRLPRSKLDMRTWTSGFPAAREPSSIEASRLSRSVDRQLLNKKEKIQSLIKKFQVIIISHLLFRYISTISPFINKLKMLYKTNFSVIDILDNRFNARYQK